MCSICSIESKHRSALALGDICVSVDRNGKHATSAVSTAMEDSDRVLMDIVDTICVDEPASAAVMDSLLDHLSLSVSREKTSSISTHQLLEAYPVAMEYCFPTPGTEAADEALDSILQHVLSASEPVSSECSFRSEPKSSGASSSCNKRISPLAICNDSKDSCIRPLPSTPTNRNDDVTELISFRSMYEDVDFLFDDLLNLVCKDLAAESSPNETSRRLGQDDWVRELAEACFATPDKDEHSGTRLRSTFKAVTVPKIVSNDLSIEPKGSERFQGIEDDIPKQKDPAEGSSATAVIQSYMDAPVSQNIKRSFYIEESASLSADTANTTSQSGSSETRPRSCTEPVRLIYDPQTCTGNCATRQASQYHRSITRISSFDYFARQSLNIEASAATLQEVNNDLEACKVMSQDESPSIKILKRPFKHHVLPLPVSAFQLQEPYTENEVAADGSRNPTCDSPSPSKRPRVRQPFKKPTISQIQPYSASAVTSEAPVSGQSIDSEISTALDNTVSEPRRPRRLRKSTVRIMEHDFDNHSSNIPDSSSSRSPDEKRIVGQTTQEHDATKLVRAHLIDSLDDSCRVRAPEALGPNIILPVAVESTHHASSSSFGSIRARQSFRLPLSTKVRVDPDTKFSSASDPTSGDDSWANRGWETASGKTMDIPHDPVLAAEWHQAETPHTLTSFRQDKSTIIAKALTREITAQKHEQVRVQKQLLDLREDVKAVESALTIESRNEDPKLLELTKKWTEVAQLACEEVFKTISAKIEHVGGYKEWRRMQEPCSWSSRSEEAREPEGESHEDEYDLTSAEKEAMGVVENDFTMEMMLKHFGIPLSLIGYDADMCRWL